MADPTRLAKLWGKFVLHNKLLTEAQWQDSVAAWKAAKGAKPIEKVMVEKGYLKPQHVKAIGERIQAVLKQAQSQAEGEKPDGPPAAERDPAKAASKPAEAAAGGSGPQAASTSPPPEKTQEGDDESGIIPLSDEDLPEDVRDANEIAWSSELAEETGGAEADDYADELGEEIAPIDLVGDDESYDPSRSQIRHDVRDWTPPAQEKPAAGDAPPEAKPDAAAAAAPADAETAAPVEPGAEDERVESPVAPLDLDEQAIKILTQAVKLGASDIHMAAGSPPFCRLHGTLTFFKLDALTPDRARRMALGFMDDAQQQQYLQHHDLDFSWEYEDLGRFRVNALEQFRGPSIIFRHIPKEVPTLENLQLPPVLGKLTEWTQGLVLVTGPAGSGKTTTAAAMVNLVNENRSDHVITVEDPVEYIHVSKGCNVSQRQVPNHTQSFATALKGALREDPDVIMIGEMRDLETVSLALRAAETGHLVIGTLQTKSAARTIDRVVDVFPADQQAQIRTMLAESLRGVISQTLVKRADGKGRVPAVESLYVTRAVSNLIRDGKTFQLPSIMQTGRKIGQRLLDESLAELLKQGIISREEAERVCENPKRLDAPPPSAEAQDAAPGDSAQDRKGWFKKK